MAERGRDFTMNIASDTSKFDVSDVADELDAIVSGSGDAASALGKVEGALSDVASEGGDAARSVGKTESALSDLGREGTDAAQGLSKVDSEMSDLGTGSADAARDLEKVQDELKRVAAEGKDAEKQLAEIDKELKASQFDEYGKDAEGAAKKIDTALDKVDKSLDAIGKSAKTNLGRVDDEAEHAKKGIADMGEEAQSTGKEAAASFGGVEDALSAVQELAANALSGFGPAGVAAGAAVAVGIGLISSGLQDAADKANAAKDRVISLAGAITDAGGDLSKVDFVGTLREWSDAIADNKSWWEIWQKDNTTNFEIVQRQAHDAGIAFDDFFAAMNGGDPAAAARELDLLNRRLEENARAHDAAALATLGSAAETQASLGVVDQERQAIQDAKDALMERTGETEAAIERSGEMAKALGIEAEATEAQKQAMQDAADATAANAEANKAAAETITTATDDMATAAESAAKRMAKASPKKDKWEDWRDTAVASVDDVIAAQEKDIASAIDFQTNQERVFAAVGQAGVDWANAQGPNSAKAMQLLADAPKKKQTEIVNNYTHLGNLQSEGVGDGFVDGIPKISSAAARGHEAAKRQLDKEIKIPTGVSSPSTSDLSSAHSAAASYFYRHPVKVEVIPVYGHGTFRVT